MDGFQYTIHGWYGNLSNGPFFSNDHCFNRALQSTIPGAHSFNGRLDFQGKKNQEKQPGRFMAVATSLYLKLPVKDCKIFQAGIYI